MLADFTNHSSYPHKTNQIENNFCTLKSYKNQASLVINVSEFFKQSNVLHLTFIFCHVSDVALRTVMSTMVQTEKSQQMLDGFS